MKLKNNKKAEIFEYSEKEISDTITLITNSELPDSVKKIIIHCLLAVQSINALIQKKKYLRKLIGRFFGFKSEKSTNESQKEGEDDKRNDPGSGNGNAENTSKNGGHGRRGYNDLDGAEKIFHKHPTLNTGDPCPEEFCDGKVYIIKNPGVYVRIRAVDPIQSVVHLVEKLRCNLCGKIFEVLPTEVIQTEKYDESIFAYLIMGKCYYGISHNRMASNFVIKATTQSELIAIADKLLSGIFDRLCFEVANDYLISFDDTKMKIQPSKKGGIKSAWASAFVSSNCVVYFIDREHAGIGLKKLLELRSSKHPPVLALSDALPSYEKYKEGTIDIHCNVHGRRRFINAASDDEVFASELKSMISKIYQNDRYCKNMGHQDRMEYHRKHSGPLYNEIMDKIQEGIETKRFLPNSEMGKAIEYWSEDFNKLSAVIRIPGVLLDTNHVERKIKSPIRIRKQAPIFKTEEGARRIGRLLSLVESAIMNDVDPFDYLVWALKGVKSGVSPSELTPWMFKRHLEMLQKPPP